MVGSVAVIASLWATGEWAAFTVTAVIAAPAAAGYGLGRVGARLLGPAGQRRAVLVAVMTGAAVALVRAAG